MTFLPLPMETDRLRLRDFGAQDKTLELAIHGDPSLFTHLPIDPRSESQVDDYVEARLSHSSFDEVGVTLAVVIEAKSTGGYVGAVQLTSLALEPLQLGIGWMALTGQQGQGYMSEAARALLDLVFRQVGTHRMVAEIVDGNQASIRLAERLGFRKEAHFVHSLLVDGIWRDELVYSLLQDEWQALHA